MAVLYAEWRTGDPGGGGHDVANVAACAFIYLANYHATVTDYAIIVASAGIFRKLVFWCFRR